MSRIIERALSIINDNLKDQTTSFADPISIKPMARGGDVYGPVRDKAKKLGVDLDLEKSRDRTLLHWVENRSSNKGAAKEVIQSALNAANEIKHPVYLTVMNGDKNLMNYYKKMGFDIHPEDEDNINAGRYLPGGDLEGEAPPVMIRDPMARGGHVLEDDYPTHYLPHVGRQVMADGGDADPVGGALDVAQSIPETPMPSLRPTPPAPSVPSAEGRVGEPKSLKDLVGVVPAKAPWAKISEQESKQPTMKSLKEAFDTAIARHTSLPRRERVASSKDAAEKLAPYIGIRKGGKPIPLLGKNAKLMKSEAGYKGEKPVELEDGSGVETTGLALAPAFKMGKFNTCPNSASCEEECLGKTSGNYFQLGGGKNLYDFKGPRLNGLNKTLAMMQEPEAFAIRLHDEIMSAKREADYNGNRLGVRLNVLSDINPLIHKALIEAHPDVDFYDYTKNNSNPVAPNHHYTYSSTGVSQEGVENPNNNWKQMRKRLDGGDNVAMAFSHKKALPEEVHDEETGKVYKVINGDSHDFRPLDKVPKGMDGVIIGLKNKDVTSKNDTAHIESDGFFVKYDPKFKKTAKGTQEKDENGNPIATNKRVSIKKQDKAMSISDNDGKKIGD